MNLNGYILAYQLKIVVNATTKLIDSVIEWLRHHAHNQHGVGSKPTPAIPLCPWKRYFAFPCLVILTSSSKLRSYIY